MTKIALACLLFPFAAPAGAAAGSCGLETFAGARYTICSFDPAATDMRIVWRNPDGVPYRTFPILEAALEADGLALAFAMNGGMYQADLSPVGLLVIDGEELHAANTAVLPAGTRPLPNFYRQPNGIFWLGGGRAGVAATDAYLAAPPDAEFATQSGPMLVIDGAIHADFIPGSTDRRIRNGVGVSTAGTVHFAISDEIVNFHDFALLFRDRLDSPNALFLDGGSAPALHAPSLRRSDPPGHGGFGPIIAVIGTAETD